VKSYEKNKHANKKHKDKKAIVAGIKDRATGEIRAEPVPEATAARLTHFIESNVEPGCLIYTDENKAYDGLPNHETVNHSAREYVRDKAHTNGIESFWASLDRGIMGIFHHISKKHLHRYVSEFAERLNMKAMDTVDMMKTTVRNMVGKRLTYKMLVG